MCIAVAFSEASLANVKMGQQGFNMSTVDPMRYHHSFGSRSGAHFIASWRIGPSSISERASDDKRLQTLDNTMLQSFSEYEISQTETYYSLASSFVSINSDTWETSDT